MQIETSRENQSNLTKKSTIIEEDLNSHANSNNYLEESIQRKQIVTIKAELTNLDNPTNS